MTKTETLHFTYESPENLCKLLCTIHFEKTCQDKVLNYLWHDFFGRNKSDETVYRLMTELWPQGCTMNVDEIEQLTERMKAFLLEDEELIKKRVEYEKQRYPLYVFSKWNNKVVQCGFAEHVDKIAELCAEFLVNRLKMFRMKQYLRSSIQILRLNRIAVLHRLLLKMSTSCE